MIYLIRQYEIQQIGAGRCECVVYGGIVINPHLVNDGACSNWCCDKEGAVGWAVFLKNGAPNGNGRCNIVAKLFNSPPRTPHADKSMFGIT